MGIKNEPRWNPSDPLEISPEEYERQVVAWLKEAGGNLNKLEIRHQKKVTGKSGEYTLDGWAEFQIFQGSNISVLIECKRHKRPVERDTVLGVHAKLKEVNAHKAMIFSTAGFQRGALGFASKNGIALITFIDGKLTYETRSAEPPSTSCYPTDLPKYAGQMISSDGNKTKVSTIDDKDLSPLMGWLAKKAVDQEKEAIDDSKSGK